MYILYIYIRPLFHIPFQRWSYISCFIHNDMLKPKVTFLSHTHCIIKRSFLLPCYQFLSIEELKLNRQQWRGKIILWGGVTFQTLPTTPGWCKLFRFFDLSTRGEALICPHTGFYRTQVYLGSDLWVRVSLTEVFET